MLIFLELCLFMFPKIQCILNDFFAYNINVYIEQPVVLPSFSRLEAGSFKISESGPLSKFRCTEHF
jgi:hypothetical protein